MCGNTPGPDRTRGAIVRTGRQYGPRLGHGSFDSGFVLGQYDAVSAFHQLATIGRILLAEDTSVAVTDGLANVLPTSKTLIAAGSCTSIVWQSTEETAYDHADALGSHHIVAPDGLSDESRCGELR